MFIGMPQCGVPLAASLKFMTPGDGEIIAEDLTGVGVFFVVLDLGEINGEEDVNVGIEVIGVIAFIVFPVPDLGEEGGGRVGIVDDVEHHVLILLCVSDEFSAEVCPEPGPFSFGAAGAVEGDEAAALMDVVLKSLFLLFGIEGFIVGIVEDENVVFGDFFEGEDGRVVGDVIAPVVFLTDGFEAIGGGGYVFVDIAFAIFGVNQHQFLGTAPGEKGEQQAGNH